MRRVIPDRRSGNELLRLLRVTDITPMQSGDCLPGFPNQCGESSSDRQALRRVPPELSKPVRRVPPDRHAGIELLRLPQPVRRVIPRKSRSSPDCAQNKNSSQHSPSVMRVSKCNGIRAHTHASTRRLCRPCLCFFYNFFINIILFYYWVTNRDFIDLFCHTPQTCFATPSDLLCPLRSALSPP